VVHVVAGNASPSAGTLSRQLRLHLGLLALARSPLRWAGLRPRWLLRGDSTESVLSVPTGGSWGTGCTGVRVEGGQGVWHRFAWLLSGK
jgi:hypothetical protein